MQSFAVNGAIIWAFFTVLIRHWRLHAIRAVAIVSFLSLILMLPGYFAWYGVDHVRALPLGAMAMQALVQGLGKGILAITAYGQAIRVLGVSRAVLFPAMVPAVSIAVGIPIVGEFPDGFQITGLFMVTAGLLGAVGVFRLRLLRRRPGGGIIGKPAPRLH